MEFLLLKFLNVELIVCTGFEAEKKKRKEFKYLLKSGFLPAPVPLFPLIKLKLKLAVHV